MNSDNSQLSREFKKSFTPEIIDRIRKEDFEAVQRKNQKNILDIASGFIPVVGWLKSRSLFQDYKDYRFGEKIIAFLRAFAKESYSQEDLNGMISEIEGVNSEFFFETLTDTLDRIDNANKARILGNILHNCIIGYISRDNFLRHSWILSNVPYIDLQQLYKYTEDYYEPSSSDILAANGLIRETTLDEGTFASFTGGCKYGLTLLGEEILKYGFFYPEWQYKGSGRHIKRFEQK